MTAAAERRPAPPHRILVGPNSRPQAAFLSTPADIAFYGGSAGSGKTRALLLDPLRHTHRPGFAAVLFRRTYPRITQAGGAWEESVRVYSLLPDARAIPGRLMWIWRSGATLRMSHLQHESDVDAWKGAQIAEILFDQIEEFEEAQFWYLLSRNRSAIAGMRPVVRATCNPDPDSFVARLVEWYIDPATGYPLPERSGLLRFFFRDYRGELHWADTREALYPFLPKQLPAGIRPEDVVRSFTFIPGKLTDNADLMRRDPSYYGSLLALPHVERERLLEGNWHIRATAGRVFPKQAWQHVPFGWVVSEFRQGRILGLVRWWDKASTSEVETSGTPSATVGVLMARHVDPQRPFIVVDVRRGYWGLGERDGEIRSAMQWDAQTFAGKVVQWSEQEPGSGGKESARATGAIAAQLGVEYHFETSTGSKLERAAPIAAAQQNGLVAVVDAQWTPAYIEAMHRVGPASEKRMDECDATSGAYSKARMIEHLTKGSYATAKAHA